MRPRSVFSPWKPTLKLALPSALLASFVALSGAANAFNLLPKPQTDHDNPEGGRSIAQYNNWTLFSADDDFPFGRPSQNGALYLYENNNPNPIRTYQFYEPGWGTSGFNSIGVQGDADHFSFLKLGRRVAMNENWIVAAWATPMTDMSSSVGPSKPAVVVVGKENGVWGSCSNNNCVQSATSLNNIVYDSSVQILQHPALSTLDTNTSPYSLSVDVSGDSIVVGRGRFSNSGAAVVFTYANGSWSGTPLPYVNDGESGFGTSVAIDGDRIVVGAPKYDGGKGRIYVFEREGQNWVAKAKYTPPGADSNTAFGVSIDLSGNDVIVGSENGSPAFLELSDVGMDNLSVHAAIDFDIGSNESFTDLAIDNGKAVASGSSVEPAITYVKDGHWIRTGGITAGLYPFSEYAGRANTTANNIWSIDFHGDTIALGWRNYSVDRVINGQMKSVQDGAAITASFNKASCEGAKIQAVSATSSSVENGQYNAANAIDGNINTRWSSAFSDPQWITVDLGEDRLIGKVVLDWEAAHSSQYVLQVNESKNANNPVWRTFYTRTNGQGGVEVINQSDFETDQNFAAFGRYIRMYSTQRGTPWGNSLFEFEVYSAKHSKCPSQILPWQSINLLNDYTSQIQSDWSLGRISTGHSFQAYRLNVFQTQEISLDILTEGQSSLGLFEFDLQVFHYSNEANPWGPQTNAKIEKVLQPGSYILYIYSGESNQLGDFFVNVSSSLGSSSPPFSITDTE